MIKSHVITFKTWDIIMRLLATDKYSKPKILTSFQNSWGGQLLSLKGMENIC